MEKYILISLCGMSPAVISETVYALCGEGIVPETVIAITTTVGAGCIRRELLDSGRWRELRRELGLNEAQIRFGASSQYLRIIPSGQDDNADAGDIVTHDDNQQAANYILDVLRQFTENADTTVIFSIAGGRKTMSALGALCMSLLGREHDRLCHVLVNPPFDHSGLQPKFYWPPRRPVRYRTPEAGEISSTEARLTLCDLPFVRLRYLFSEQYRRLPGTFTDTVRLANQSLALELPELCFDATARQCRIGESELKLSPFEFLLYWTLAEQRLRKRKPFTLIIDLMEAAEKCADTNRFDVMTGFDFKYKFSQLDEKNSKNPEHAVRYCARVISNLKNKIEAVARWREYLPSVRKGIYGLELPPEKIKIE